MLGKLFLSLKDNLIAKGLPEDKISTFESYLIGKNRKLLFPEVISRDFGLSYQQAQSLLMFLSTQKLTTRVYRIDLPEDNTFIDYYNVFEIPSEIEFSNGVIPTEDRTYLLFKGAYNGNR